MRATQWPVRTTWLLLVPGTAWTWGAELTSDRLHGVLCKENERLERQRLLFISPALVSMILWNLTSQW